MCMVSLVTDVAREGEEDGCLEGDESYVCGSCHFVVVIFCVWDVNFFSGKITLS